MRSSSRGVAHQSRKMPRERLVRIHLGKDPLVSARAPRLYAQCWPPARPAAATRTWFACRWRWPRAGRARCRHPVVGGAVPQRLARGEHVALSGLWSVGSGFFSADSMSSPRMTISFFRSGCSGARIAPGEPSSAGKNSFINVPFHRGEHDQPPGCLGSGRARRTPQEGQGEAPQGPHRAGMPGVPCSVGASWRRHVRRGHGGRGQPAVTGRRRSAPVRGSSP